MAKEDHRSRAILVDDRGHQDDIIEAVLAVLGGGEEEDLRSWLRGHFFSNHLATYSGSRRTAPIYWQIGLPSGRYSVWMYYLALSRDDLFKIHTEYAGPKLAQEERKLEALRREIGADPKTADRKALASQETLVEELRALLDEVNRVAPLWSPNLDDGVIINFCPLWRLVPHNKAWQKELKATWDGLCSGDYDWARLAMHLWPERVVPKCATDRSLAIAHGVEDVFWIEGSDGKWKARATPVRPADELVRERSSSAVKAALESLLDAPTSVTGRAHSHGAASPAVRERGSR